MSATVKPAPRAVLRPPPSLHEAEVERWAEPDGKPDPILSGLATAVKAARLQAERLSLLDGALQADASKPPAARALALRQAAERAGEAAAPVLDSALAKARETAEKLERETMPPAPRDPMQIGLLAESRALLRGLDPSARAAALGAALTNGEDLVIAGAVHGPGLLSGLSAEQQADLARRYRIARHPDVVARLERLAKAAQATETAGRLLISFIMKFVDTPEARAAAAAADRVADLTK